MQRPTTSPQTTTPSIPTTNTNTNTVPTLGMTTLGAEQVSSGESRSQGETQQDVSGTGGTKNSSSASTSRSTPTTDATDTSGRLTGRPSNPTRKLSGLDLLISAARPATASTTVKQPLPASPAPTQNGGSKPNGKVTHTPNVFSSSVPASRPPLNHGYVTTTALPTTSTTASTVGGSMATRRSSGKADQANKAPVLFDFRTTDRSPSSAKKGDPTASTGMSLLSQGLKDGPSPSAISMSSSPSTRQPFPPPVASNNAAASGILRRTSTSGGKSGIYSPMPAPRMRPRALSMQMKIKGEILPDGASDDEDDEDEGMVVDGDESGERGKAVPLGTGSGGIKGKRKGMVFRCESCAKVYRHPSCLSKHRWEHSPHWANSSKLLLSKHQQVQLLEAATILVHLDPGNPAGQGKSLPEDKSLWPAAVSPAVRNIKLPTHGISPGPRSPNPTASSPLPDASENHVRRTSPDDSSSSTESSDRARSVEADSGYSSGPQHGRLLDIGETPQRRGSQFGRASISSPLGHSVGSNGQGSLPDFNGFHIGSPQRYPLGTTPTHGSSPYKTGGKPQSFGHSYSYGSSHTARAGLFSPSYSPALGLPQSSLRSGTFLERHDEDSAEEDEDDTYRDRYHGGNQKQNGGFASRGQREMSLDRTSPSPDGDDMDMAVDMEI